MQKRGRVSVVRGMLRLNTCRYIFKWTEQYSNSRDSSQDITERNAEIAM